MAMKRALALALLVACGGGSDGPPERLSEWGLFTDGATQTPASDVVPYEVISPLFSDYASKHRFIRVPAGETIQYRDDGIWDFPEGTVLVKTFAFLRDRRDPSAGERLIETRLFVLEEGIWTPYVYLWNDDASEATYMATGERVDVSWIHDDGTPRDIVYRVPNVVQCANCHGGSGDVLPLGPSSQQLDRDNVFAGTTENQIDHMDDLGLFAGDVPTAREHFAAPDGPEDIEARARAYLHANCSHCHRPEGAAQQSGLWLTADVTDPTRLGICKRPVAAGAGAGGRRYDVVPGAPDDSVFLFRMESEEPGIKMPELPTVLSHAEGVALIREWIASLPGDCE